MNLFTDSTNHIDAYRPYDLYNKLVCSMWTCKIKKIEKQWQLLELSLEYLEIWFLWMNFKFR